MSVKGGNLRYDSKIYILYTDRTTELQTSPTMVG